MKRIVAACALLAFVACSPPAVEAPEAAAPITPVVTDLPAGAYTVDPSHSSFVLRANHLGFAFYTARFTRFNAQLQLDPANPAAASLVVTIDPRAIDADNAPAGFLNELRGPQWLDAAQFPEISYRSTAIELTGADTARITGDLTLHGVTRPVTLEAKFNGGYTGHPMDPNARIGFSVTGTLKRSEFGIAYGIPAPGSNLGVGDDIQIVIETELNGPAWTPPAAPQ